MKEALKMTLTAGAVVAMTVSSAVAESDVAPNPDLTGKTVEFVVGRYGDPFVMQEICGAEDAASELGLVLTASGPGVWSPTDQLPYLNAAIAKNPDALILEATDSTALNQELRTWVETSRPLITVDAGITEPWSVAFIASDNTAGGALAAKSMAQAINGEGKVLVLDVAPGIGILEQRQNGFTSELAAFPGIEYLGVQYGGDDPTKISEIINATLAQHPDLAGIYATATLIGEAAGAAIQEAGAADSVHVVAFDASAREVELLRSGGIDELIVQKPYLMGYLGVQAAAAALLGEPYKGETVTDYVVATAENVDDPEVSRWLYSTECH